MCTTPSRNWDGRTFYYTNRFKKWFLSVPLPYRSQFLGYFDKIWYVVVFWSKGERYWKSLGSQYFFDHLPYKTLFLKIFVWMNCAERYLMPGRGSPKYCKLFSWLLHCINVGGVRILFKSVFRNYNFLGWSGRYQRMDSYKNEYNFPIYLPMKIWFLNVNVVVFRGATLETCI